MMGRCEHRPYQFRSDDWLRSEIDRRSVQLAQSDSGAFIDFYKNRILLLGRELNHADRKLRTYISNAVNAQRNASSQYHFADNFSS